MSNCLSFLEKQEPNNHLHILTQIIKILKYTIRKYNLKKTLKAVKQDKSGLGNLCSAYLFHGYLRSGTTQFREFKKIILSYSL